MKYEGNKAVVDEPSVWTISDGTVKVKRAEGIDSYTYEGDLTILFGDLQAWAPANIDPVEVTPIEPTPDSGGGDNPGGDSGGDNPGGESGGETPGGEDNPDTPVNPDTPTGSDKITFRLVNNSGVEARFNGKVVLNLWNDTSYLSTTAQLEWSRNVQVQCTFTGGQKSNNYIIIPAGQTKDFDIPKSSMVYTVHHIGGPEVDDLKDDNLYGNVNYLNGSWYIKRTYNPYNSGAPTFIYTLMQYGRINHKDDDTHSSNSMYNVGIANPAKLENGLIYTITINSMNSEASFDDSNHYMILN